MNDFSEILNIIKETSQNVIDDDKPTKVLIGKVINEVPLQIFVDQKYVLEENFLLFSKTISNSLKLDDKVILLSMLSGQRYIVIDRLYE